MRKSFENLLAKPSRTGTPPTQRNTPEFGFVQVKYASSGTIQHHFIHQSSIDFQSYNPSADTWQETFSKDGEYLLLPFNLQAGSLGKSLCTLLLKNGLNGWHERSKNLLVEEASAAAKDRKHTAET